jgi:AraC-like DNA-binding protein
MRNFAAERLPALPSAEGGMTRLAFACGLGKGVDVDALLRKAGLSRIQIKDPHVRISVRSQVVFLDLVAKALGDDLLGFHLSQNFDLRMIGLLYYVLASSETLGEALGRVARYSSLVNEGFRVTVREGREIDVVLESVGIPRRLNRHQIEFSFVTFIRACREITKRRLTANHVRFVHRRNLTSEMSSFFGGDVEFGADVDQVTFSRSILDIAVVSADPYLNKLLIKQYEGALAHRKLNRNAFALRVENAIVPLLPHGKAQASEVARKLGVTQRTFARRLASEGLTFVGMLKELRLDLAKRDLADRDLSISKIAWLLGYQDVSSFTHAFKRWTGNTPRAIRQAELNHA